MKINLKKGKKNDGDKLILIDSENECITVFDIACIINQFAINELNIIDSQGFSKDKHFWFSVLIDKAIEDARQNINWFECDKDSLLYLSKYPYFVKLKLIDKFFEGKNDRD